MGCCASTDATNSLDKQRNDEIEQQIKNDRLNLRNEVKMLLLGAGESGKSTILKQMKLIHNNGSSPGERESYREVIFKNTITSMRVILEAMDDLEIELGPGVGRYADSVRNYQTQYLDENAPKSFDIGGAIKELWRDPGVKTAFSRRNEFQLNDSAAYFFEAIDRISGPQYLPTDQDVLRSRIRTTGISETRFQIGELSYRMFDVGGQRSERKKWIHCFENVTAIIFLVAISEFDQTLIEDEGVNRLSESLTLFDSICNSRWFNKTSIILFLNKTDLFKEKLAEQRQLSAYFPDYTGRNDDFDSAKDYIMNKFVELNRSDDKQIYTHFTCATDTEQIRFVMDAVNDIILQKNLADIHLM